MGKEMSEDNDTAKKILELVRSSDYESVEALIVQAGEELGIPEDLILDQIIILQKEGKLTLTSVQKVFPSDFQTFLFSIHAIWFWIILALSTTTLIFMFKIAEDAYPYVYFRYLFGSFFVLVLPGYCLIKIIYPINEIDDIERMAFSLGISLLLVPLIGFFFNYTPWGIEPIPITLSLLTLTIFFAMIGLIREHKERTHIYATS